MKHTFALAAFVAAMMAVLATPQSAFADDMQFNGYTFQSGPLCVYSRSRTAHGNGNGLAETRVQSESDDFLGNQCVNFNDQPPGYMVVKWEWWKWRSDLGQWVLCNYSPDWMYNEITNYYMVRQKVFLSNQTCGPAYYGTMAAGFVWHGGQGGWRGAWLWSGYHWFPAA